MKNKSIEVDFDEGSSTRIALGEWFAGTTVVYAAKGDDAFGMKCDYKLSTMTATHSNEVRLVRKSRRRNGGKVKRLPDDRIRDELVVIFGPDMSANSAVATLKHLAKKIQAEGLLIGEDADGYDVEYVSDPL